ncbi:MAG: hypothetical protein VB913_13645 [Rhodospirillales bacterium]|jgi:hypothetical protein
MSKARARERAKARKGKKRVPKVELPTQQFGSGKFDPGGGSIKGPQTNNVKSFATAKRGSARSG